jgi:threonylcarbamoyladenosine tRNA methylthiotransferase MtaB
VRLHIIRRYLPGSAIGADVIVGFPGESDADFQATVEFIERLPFTYLHIFSFSERPGTEAARLSERVERGVIQERARALRDLGAKKSATFRASQAGSTQRVLTLARGADDWTEALTGNYLKVRIAGRRHANQWCDVRVPLDPAEVVGGLEPDQSLIAAPAH